MGHQNRPREEWQHDIENRQRNVVFPDTALNEARFWRNVGNQSWTPATKIGLGILAVGFGAFVVRVVVALVVEGVALRMALGMLLIWGPIFGAVAWATRRALRYSSHHSKHRK
jgi:hypothetical protein